MQNNKTHILSTKEIDHSLVDLASMYNIEIEQVPFIKTIECITPGIEEGIYALTQQNEYVVFTSSNAVKAVSKLIKGQVSWKIFCVGEKTKLLIEKKLRAESIISAANYAEELADIIIKEPAVKEIIFFCGNLHREEFSQKLEKNGIKITEIIVYNTILTPHNVSENYDGILFFSPSAVKSFFSENSIAPATSVFAIGSTTADEIKLFSDCPLIVPDTPSFENMIKKVVTTFGKTKNEKWKI